MCLHDVWRDCACNPEKRLEYERKVLEMMRIYRLLAYMVAMFLTFNMYSLAQPEGQPVRLGVSASVEATDNRDAAVSQKTSNMDVFLRPYVEFRMNTGMTQLHLLYEPGLRYRTEPGDSQNDVELHHRLDLALFHGISERSRVRFNNTFLKIEDPRIAEGGAILRENRSYMVNTARASFNYDLGRLSNIDLQAHNQIRLYDESRIARLSDKVENGLGVDYRLQLTPTMRALFNGAYGMYSFKDDGVRSRDFEGLSGSAGLEYVFTTQVIGSLVGGVQSRSYDDERLEMSDNLYLQGNVSGMLTQDLRMGIVAGTGVRDADVYPYASQEYVELRGFVDSKLSPAITLRIGATVRQSSYDSHPMLNLPGGSEDVVVGDAQVSYQLTEQASILVGHRIEDISADQGLSNSYTRNTSRVGMRMDF
jgi:hypothetical protein